VTHFVSYVAFCHIADMLDKALLKSLMRRSVISVLTVRHDAKTLIDKDIDRYCRDMVTVEPSMLLCVLPASVRTISQRS